MCVSVFLRAISTFFSMCGASLACEYWQVIAFGVKKAKTILVSWAKEFNKKIGALNAQF